MHHDLASEMLKDPVSAGWGFLITGLSVLIVYGFAKLFGWRYLLETQAQYSFKGACISGAVSAVVGAALLLWAAI